MNLLHVLRYLAACAHCLAWPPPRGLVATVTIDIRFEELAVNILDPHGYQVTLRIDPSLPLRTIGRALDAATAVLAREADPTGAEPELMWD